MKKLFIIISLLALTGAGCVQLKKSEVAATGGVFATSDAGVSWSAKSTLPLPSGVSSINTTNITAIAFDPSDADAIYLGTQENGLLYSYDNGESWLRPKQAELKDGWIAAVAVDPSAKCTIYAAKGNNVMKSTDCARTWDTQTFVEGNGNPVLALKIDWFNPSIVWIGTSVGDVLKSSDGGATWSTMARVKDDVFDLLIDNGDSRIVIVATKGKSVWRTTDGGANWTRQEEELKAFRNSGSGLKLAQNKTGSVIYYANEYGLLKSLDHGASWEGLTLVTRPGSVKILSLAVNPDDGNNVYYGTATTLNASTDGGANWSTRELPTTRAATALAVDPDETSLLFMGVTTLED